MASTSYIPNRQSGIPASTNNYIFPDASLMYPCNIPTDNTLQNDNDALAALFADQVPTIHSVSSRRSPSTDSDLTAGFPGPFDDELDLFTLFPILAPQDVALDLTRESNEDYTANHLIDPTFHYPSATQDSFFPDQILPEVAIPALLPYYDFVDTTRADTDTSPFAPDILYNTVDDAFSHQEDYGLPTQAIKTEENVHFPSSLVDHDADHVSGGRRRKQRTRRSTPKPYPSSRPESSAKCKDSAASLLTYSVAETSEHEGRRFIIPCLQPHCQMSCTGVEDLRDHLISVHGVSASKGGKNAKRRVPCEWATFQSPDGMIQRRQHLREILKLLDISFRCKGSIEDRPCGRTYSRLEMIQGHWKKDHGNAAGASWDEVYKNKY